MRGNRWAMTERGRHAVARTRDCFSIGPSALEWNGTELTIHIDEMTAPIPSRMRGTVRVFPEAFGNRSFALDAHNRHTWWPIAPRSALEVDLPLPGVKWRGSGYIDSNFADQPLEDGFRQWDWSRANVGRDSAVLYDITRANGQKAALAIQIDRSGEVTAFEAPETVDLSPAAIWRMPRRTQADAGAASVHRTLEDAPFYARSELKTRLLGHDTVAMHESLSLERFRSGVLKTLLPWRMPRALW